MALVSDNTSVSEDEKESGGLLHSDGEEERDYFEENGNRILYKAGKFQPEDDGNTPDEVLLQLGGCGVYQFLLTLIIQSMKCVVCWGMVGNVFISYEPKWRCSNYTANVVNTTSVIIDDRNMSLTSEVPTWKNQSLTFWNEQCYERKGVRCTDIEFSDDIHTLVSEFDLVCHRSWVTATIVSIQMSGMCVGSILSGQLSDLIGRKRPLISAMAMFCIFHFISYFSVNWAMFAACRFFIGIASAFHLTIDSTIQSEFMLSKWRSIVIGFPSWAIESALFALVAWLLNDWKPLVLVISAMGLGFTVIGFFVPESFRWYVINDRHEEVEALTKKIARWNKHPAPNQERIRKLLSRTKSDKSKQRCFIGLVDLFRVIPLLKLTLPLAVTWITMGLSAYGMNFGVKKLSGSIYLNIFLFGIASVPSKFASIYLMNKFGRKVAAICAFSLTGVSGLIVAIIHNVDSPQRDVLINSFALAATVGVDATWGPIQTLSVEVYPTVVRNVGFGFVSVLARVGAVIGPQFVYLGEQVPGILYFVVALTCLMAVISILCLPETMDTNLLDKITEDLEQHRKKERTV